MDAHPADGLILDGLIPGDERDDDRQAQLHQLMLERQERATEILRVIYRVARDGMLDSATPDDVRFICAELGLDWNDVTGRKPQQGEV